MPFGAGNPLVLYAAANVSVRGIRGPEPQIEPTGSEASDSAVTRLAAGPPGHSVGEVSDLHDPSYVLIQTLVETV